MRPVVIIFYLSCFSYLLILFQFISCAVYTFLYFFCPG